LVQSYAQELSMRSVLDSDMINHALTGDSINHPTAWPAIIADSTPLLDVLGLKGQIELLLNRHGQLRCSNCGGLGPVKSVNEVTNRYLTTQDLAVVCEAPSAIVGHPNQKQWLAAAGYRDFINGDDIVIDRLPQGLSADELSERCQDIEIQLRQLDHTKFSIHDNSGLPLATFDLNNCQDCKQQHSLEARLNGKSLADIYDSAVGNALDFFAHLNCPILKHATKLLKPTSLLTHKSKSKMSRLTSVEQRCARIVSLLLFAPQSLGLLFDNIFAGLPARLGQFLASECETSRLLMTHADASGYFGQSKPAALKSTLTLSPVSFSSNFAFEDFIPGRAKPDVSLLAALELEYDLADYFSRSETAKLIGLSSADFIKQKSKHKCQSCKGNGYIQIHAYFYYACILCRGSSFDHTMSQVVERGLSFTQAVRSTIAELQVYFSGTKLEAALSNAVELGLGDYTLSQPMAELPAACRSIAPLCNYLGQREGEIRIRGLFDGLSCLQAQQVSTRIQSLGFIHSILEWRENHPQFLNEP
ncbi:MAG: hypothetical protein QGF46_07080, partial [Planctomycetota bacterium]|nr:hypothetical protein [Planctomycetota bacterium]